MLLFISLLVDQEHLSLEISETVAFWDPLVVFSSAITLLQGILRGPGDQSFRAFVRERARWSGGLATKVIPVSGCFILEGVQILTIACRPCIRRGFLH